MFNSNRLRTNKKGQDSTFSTLISSLTTALVIAILIGGIIMLSNKAIHASSIETCRDSVLVRSNANIEVKGVEIVEKATPLLCPTEDVGVLEGSREEIKEQIAELSAQCWYMYAEGRVSDLFKSDHGDKGCNTCYIFQIEEVKEGTAVEYPLDETKLGGRPENKLTTTELYNHFMTNRYDPPVIRGGGTKNIISDEYKLKSGFLEFEQKQHLGETISEVEMSDISGKGITSFVKDYSGFFDTKIAREIDVEIGSKLLLERDISLVVIVAETFDSMERKDARRLYEKLGLNSEEDKYDGIMVLADIKRGIIRVVMGKELDVYIFEHDIEDLIESSVKAKAGDSTVDISKAVQEVVNRIGDKILNEKKIKLFKDKGIDPRSYYAYMTNGINYPYIVDHVQSGLGYTISYMSSSDSKYFVDEMGLASLAALIGSAVGAAGGAAGGAAISTAIGAKLVTGAAIAIAGTTMVVAGAVVAVGAVLGVLLLVDNEIIDLKEKKPNHVLIARSTKGQKYCDMLE